MTLVALYSLVAFSLIYALWLFYLAVMNLKQARDKGKFTTTAKVFGYPILLTGYLLDFAVNITVMPFLFLELPKNILVTSTVIRHSKGTGYRKKLAAWFCTNLLDPYDPSGCHCK